MNGRLNVPESRRGELFSTALAAAAFVFALVLVAASIAAPVALASDGEHDEGQARHANGGQDGHHDNNGRRDRDHDRGGHDRDERARYEQQHYWRYQQPVYAPPPVYYAPPASPGINLVLPLQIRVR